MITMGKVTETFCMADDFCKFFDAMVAKYTLKPVKKRKGAIAAYCLFPKKPCINVQRTVAAQPAIF